MTPEPLLQKLFAIERALGNVAPATLRAMIIEAEEAPLPMKLDNLHSLERLRRSLGRRSSEDGPAECESLDQKSTLRRSA